jgi:hypothetical protein
MVNATKSPKTITAPLTAEGSKALAAAFLSSAKSVVVTLDGFPMQATAREFSTGSHGWFVSGKASVGGKQVQVSINLTVVNSKPGSETAPKARTF